MATYSVFRQDDDAESDSEPNRGPSLLAYRHPGHADTSPQDEPEHTPRDTAAPCVVLQLPDLSTPEDTADGWWPRLSNRLFWAGIILGALVALVLIWNPKKDDSPVLDEAPSWSDPALTPTTQGPIMAPAAASAAPGTSFVPPAAVHTARAPGAVWDGGAPARSGGAAPPISSGEMAPAWPNAAPAVSPAAPPHVPPVRPGEAAPTGINPW